MELRVLEYFLAVTREQSISGAAQSLHLSQPTLSRQLKDLEDELGKQLLIRGNRKVTLTEEGMILRKRAEEILGLVRKTESEISLSDDLIAGDVHIGTGETEGIRYIAKAAQHTQSQYPLIHFHISSGDSITVMEQLDRGLIDFGIVFGDIDTSKYDHMELPYKDIWGVLMRKDSPLADKDDIVPEDLWDKPLIVSRQVATEAPFQKWMRKDIAQLNIIAYYNLIFNASLMVAEGMGYALTLDKLINTTGDSSLCFRPLVTELSANISIIWKKYQLMSKASRIFLEKLKEVIKTSNFLPPDSLENHFPNNE